MDLSDLTSEIVLGLVAFGITSAALLRCQDVAVEPLLHLTTGHGSTPYYATLLLPLMPDYCWQSGIAFG